MTKYKRIIYCFACLFLIFIYYFFSTKSNGLIHNNIISAAENEKIIYLTFDDGPSNMTNMILDTLKKNNVHATFFLIGNQIKGNEAIAKRIVNEGHGVGLHSYTHKMKTIYSKKEIFIKEMHDTRDEINRAAGVTPNIIRFPGGSRNRLNEELLSLLHSCNFKIYDWNIDTSDGVRPKASPNRLVKEATKNKVKPDTIILLMHCDYMHKNTCKALPAIIKYYKSLGYEFRVINDYTPEYYFQIKK